MKIKFKKLLLAVIAVSILILICLIINKIYSKKLKENMKDISWLRENVSITEDYSIGSNVLSVNKVDEIDIY